MNPRNHSIPRSTNLIRLAALGAVAALLQTAESSTITYVGTETSTGSTYPVYDWSNASVVKNYDGDGDNNYGSAGYYQIRPTPVVEPAAANFSEAAGSDNDLGVSALADPTLSQAPAFLSSIKGGAGTYVNFAGYPNFRGPDGSSLYRQGALSVPVTEGPYDSPAGDNASRVGVPVQFTLSTAGKFRIGLAVDAAADGNFAPDYVSVYSSATGTVFSPALVCDGNPDMVFFDITGDVGNTFIVGLWQNVAAQHLYQIAPLSLITFDLVPDTAPPVLSYAIQGGNFVLSWPVAATGWTLESSTDLGADDNWDPVLGVDNNSVSVPMTAPKNFFRLKMNP
jgi:hypothetical protein